MGMRVLSKSPFDYITLSSWLSSLILMIRSQVNSHAVLNHQFGGSRSTCEPLTACGRAGAEGSEGRPAGRQT